MSTRLIINKGLNNTIQYIRIVDGIEKENESFTAKFDAKRKGDLITVFSEVHKVNSLPIFYKQIEVDGKSDFTSSVEVLEALSAFIGLGFKSGGSTPVITTEDYNEIVSKLQEADNRLQLLEAVNPITPIVYDVTPTFTIPTNGRIAARLTKGSNQSGVDTMEIIGVDTSGQSNPVTILVPFGMGYDGLETQGKSKFFPQENNKDGDAANTTETLIEVTPETANLQTQIIVPADCPGFTIKYFVGALPHKSSYYVTADGKYHPFEFENTSIDDLSGNTLTTVQIAGELVDKNDVIELNFGDSYHAVTEITQSYFVYQFGSLRKIGLEGLKNITTTGLRWLSFSNLSGGIDLSPLTKLVNIGGAFLRGCLFETIDLNVLPTQTNVGTYFLAECRNLKRVDLSIFDSLTYIPEGFLRYCQSLETLDLKPFSNVTSIGFAVFDLGAGSGTNNKLRSLDLAPLSNVTSIDKFFLRNTGGLSSLDLAPFSKVERFEEGFLQNDFPNEFMTSIDFSGCDSLNFIGKNCFSNFRILDEVIIGNKDFSQVAGDTTTFYLAPNTPDGIITTSSIELGNAFKNRITRLNKWTIQAA